MLKLGSFGWVATFLNKNGKEQKRQRMGDGFAIVGHSRIWIFVDWMAEKKGIKKGEILGGKNSKRRFGSSPSHTVQSTHMKLFRYHYYYHFIEDRYLW